jgi:hypothetical protein
MDKSVTFFKPMVDSTDTLDLACREGTILTAQGQRERGTRKLGATQHRVDAHRVGDSTTD